MKQRGKYPTVNDREVSDEEWDRYVDRYQEWKELYEGRMDTMEAAMSKPNPPGYIRANND